MAMAREERRRLQHSGTDRWVKEGLETAGRCPGADSVVPANLVTRSGWRRRTVSRKWSPVGECCGGRVGI